jgi:pimeloyl-ACP methyl ester carboxylesterase
MLLSQAGAFAFNIALRTPELIKGIVAVEPFSAPDPGKCSPDQLKALAGTPFLFVWGDYLDVPAFWRKSWQANKAFADALKSHGAKVTWWDLPEQGIRGNGHMLMMDRNSDLVARKIQEWFLQATLSR